MSCIKKQAMTEPLVDTVDQNQIVTSSELLKVKKPSYECLFPIMLYISFIPIDSLCLNRVGSLPSISGYMYQTMDISKMSSGDASFTAPFKLTAQRNDYIHALVAYFDVSFTKCHKLMGFSTGINHFRPTRILYFFLR